jgi:hypothetical protein
MDIYEAAWTFFYRARSFHILELSHLELPYELYLGGFLHTTPRRLPMLIYHSVQLADGSNVGVLQGGAGWRPAVDVLSTLQVGRVAIWA